MSAIKVSSSRCKRGAELIYTGHTREAVQSAAEWGRNALDRSLAPRITHDASQLPDGQWQARVFYESIE
jgi:hypothetical protein